ncbi:uncharacterized protein At1g51745 [Brassica rapa]|uniref:PWWP domain-containing protein n=2 Tax=Brassica TaxID=3705 RepID=A0ABQ8DF35_BRANA|nr:uncharacterized protein At1g51745 [Brassica rapa]XP_009130338.1 uncharacterized protein At1g51745 [Brassica rapa]XP_048636201.1 uncharacterized protein At1g51745-like [Brassica napus]XP_048636202.1 uncharacterized protein At1g51745-like [Brassica napus]XP_048636203.1 uncharacterized protein At1g51745-like [Brassica napus]KAH0927984.1 hypothetical protein HID58_020240 [Brassica napus]CAG7878486.1 unnamed protein product [Brassica rapa]VDD25339.1 unnamed protein product [Brassica rapa]
MEGAAGCTVGSIVWVRRRNGSWWPGKILGQDDLDSTHITSPRSGTPVKLLGREDASVDWYNLEKSKRVKPFRCGDFDDCIEKVENSQGLTIRKREKYARREDAILHALELEKEILKKEVKVERPRPRARGDSPDAAAKERMVVSRVHDISNGGLGRNHVGVVRHLGKDKEEEQTRFEEEAQPRMRGLQDFGLRTASSKRKFSSSNGPADTSFKSLARSNSSASSSGDHSMERPSFALGKEKTRNSMEAKRTKYMFAPNESNDVLDLHESLLSHRAAMHSSFAGGDHSRYSLSEYDPPEFLEDVESVSSESETDSSDMEEDTDDDIPLLSGAGRHSEQHNPFSRHMSAEDESTSSEEDCYESSMSGDSSHLYSQDPDNEAGTVSKWQLKGKRNMRNLPRRSARNGRYSEYKRRAFGQKPMGYGLDSSGTNDMSDGTDDTDPNERQFRDRMIGPGDDEYRLSSMVASGFKNIYSHDMLDWDDDPWEGQIGKKKRWEEKFEGSGQEFHASSHRHSRRNMYSPLMDVELEVRGSYQKGPVPIVSLMSKLNSRAIIGHPVEVEVLADGSSEPYIQRTEYFGNETTYHDKPFLLPHAWKTARRSSSRVPRLQPLSPSLEADADVHSPADQGRKPFFKKLGSGNLSTDDNSLRRSNLMHIPRPPGERKQQQQKKVMKNTNATPSQKTRALSSFGSEQAHSGIKALGDGTHELSNRRVLQGPPTVACIPVKLVFSRLLEKINRPPSKPL